MIINDHFKFAFVHIPKCGGMSVRNALHHLDERKFVQKGLGIRKHPELGRLDYYHMPLKIMKEFFKEDFVTLQNYRSYAVIRNPYERFPSSISQHVIQKYQFKIRPQNLSKREIKDEIEHVIGYLIRIPEGTPVTEPELIHSSRQVDYVEIDGNRLIKNLFSLENITSLLFDISERTGQEITLKGVHNNQIVYASKYGRLIGPWARHIAVSMLPAEAWRRARLPIKNILLRAGVLENWRDTHKEVFESKYVRDFIDTFYKRDIMVYDEIS